MGIGTIVDMEHESVKQRFTLLGPFDADVQSGIISMSSRVAEGMRDKKIGDKVNFKDKRFTITSITRYPLP